MGWPEDRDLRDKDEMGETMPDEYIEDGPENWGDDPEVRPPPTADPPPAWRRPAAPARDATGSRPPTADEAADHYAGQLAETSASAFMYFTMAGVFRQADSLAYKLFRDRLLVECGSPTDPIEIMLIEQLALAHLNTGRLHFKSATADGLEAARTYGALAIALAGEFRRGALALKAYRAKPQAGEGRSTKADDSGRDPIAGQEAVDGELGSNTGDEVDGGTIPLPESQAGRGREAEQGEKARPKRRRA